MSHHNIDFRVDTEPMAHEIHSVSNHVNGTTAAVVAMQAAVIKAENDGSRHICENVNRGFFSLMHSQISQKVAAKQSRAEALLIQLNAQRKRLLEIKSTMERDYQRIAARYQRIITSINKQLKQRVQDLDRPVFNFCEREMVATNNRLGLLTATVPVCQLEGVADAQKIMASNIKYDSLKAVESTQQFLEHNAEQKIITSRILLSSVRSVNAEQMMPVIITASTFDREGSENVNVTISDTAANRSMVKNEVQNHIGDLHWKDAPRETQVDQEFQRLMAQSRVSQRVKDMAMTLYKSTQTQNL